jgi:hypothetical protein
MNNVCSRGKFNPLGAQIAATSMTTFALRDMADFRRFVVTFCYDSAFFGGEN